MKRFFSLILVVFLLSQAISIAQQFRCELRPGAYTINRLEGIIWIDVDVANDFVVKEINFNDTITYNNSVIGANAIPAFCPKDDGSKDTNKYTRATPLSLNSDRFRYWMPEDPSLYLPVSANTRRIMKFYVKFVDQIPQYGEIKINFNNFSVIGVNTFLGATLDLKSPYQNAIKYNYQALPFFCFLAASLVSKSMSLFSLNKAKKKLRKIGFFFVASAGVILVAATIGYNASYVHLFSTWDYLVFRVEPTVDLGYSLISYAPVSANSLMMGLQYLGFGFALSGLVWLSRHKIGVLLKLSWQTLKGKSSRQQA